MITADKPADIRIIEDNTGKPVDLEILRSGAQPLRMLGPGGPAREEAVLAPLERAGNMVLPVLIGLGMGHGLAALLARHDGPVAVVDKECALVELVHPDIAELLENPRVLFVEGKSGAEGVEQVLKALTRWQAACGGKPFFPLPHPFHMRFDRAWYGALRERLENSRKFDFWGKARQPRFRDDVPRLLLITSRYFLVGEVAEACERIGVQQRTITLENDEIPNCWQSWSSRWCPGLWTTLIWCCICIEACPAPGWRYSPGIGTTSLHFGHRAFLMSSTFPSGQRPLVSARI